MPTARDQRDLRRLFRGDPPPLTPVQAHRILRKARIAEADAIWLEWAANRKRMAEASALRRAARRI